MAGIDSNTLLYLRGDSFNDLSSKNVAITNQNCVIDNNSIKVSTGNKLSLDGIFNQGYTGDFTIEFFVKKTSNSSGLALLQTGNSLDTDGDILVEVNIYNNLQVVLSGSKPWPTISNSYLTDNEFSYIAVVKNGNKFSLYQDGKLRGSLESSKTIYNKTNGSIYTNGGEFSIKEYRISNIARYEQDFTPPTKPFNSLSINVTSKDFAKVDFNISKLGQEVVNKIEVLVNGQVSKTYTSIGDLTYNIDKSLLFNGNNKIKIKVTFDNDYSEEKEIDYEYVINNLSTTSSLKELIDRQELLTNSIEVQKNTLKEILISKNIEVADSENKLSILIDKVNELEDCIPSILYLYNNGNEFEDITGGFTKAGQSNGVGNVSITRYVDGIYFSNSSRPNSYIYAGIGTLNSIDVSKFSKLCVEYEYNVFLSSSMRKSVIELTNNLNDNGSICSISTGLSEKHTVSLDVSNVQQSCFVRVLVADSGSNTKISRIWLEK